MKQTIFILTIFLNSVTFGQETDSVFDWQMKFNKNYIIQESCNLNNNVPDTFNVHGHIDTFFDTVVFTFNGSLHYDQNKYYLEFRDKDNKLVDIESSFYKIWTIQRSYPPYERYDSVAKYYGDIEFSIRNIQTEPFAEPCPYLNVYFYRDRDVDKYKLCTLVFIEQNEKKEKINTNKTPGNRLLHSPGQKRRARQADRQKQSESET